MSKKRLDVCRTAEEIIKQTKYVARPDYDGIPFKAFVLPIDNTNYTGRQLRNVGRVEFGEDDARRIHTSPFERRIIADFVLPDTVRF